MWAHILHRVAMAQAASIEQFFVKPPSGI